MGLFFKSLNEYAFEFYFGSELRSFYQIFFSFFLLLVQAIVQREVDLPGTPLEVVIRIKIIPFRDAAVAAMVCYCLMEYFATEILTQARIYAHPYRTGSLAHRTRLAATMQRPDRLSVT